jgi:adenosylcobyric acid synthase
VVLPRISNFTDLDALCLEPGLDVVFADSPRALSGADVVVLPGTRATVADLAWLRERGLADAVAAHARRGGAVLGVCGGFQMLGRTVADPHGVEGEPGAVVEGLGLLDVRTEFTPEKVLRLPAGTALGVEVAGYEIHHGRVAVDAVDAGAAFPGGARSGQVFGTLWHGCLEGDAFRRAWLREVGAVPDETVSFPRAREARLDLVADALEEHVDLDALLALVTSGAPSYPVVRGGLVRG